MSEEKEYKDGYNIGTVIVRNGWNVIGEYHEHHDGLVGVIVGRTMNVISIRYLTPLLSVKGNLIRGDSIYPDNIREVIVRKPIINVRQPIGGEETNDTEDSGNSGE